MKSAHTALLATGLSLALAGAGCGGSDDSTTNSATQPPASTATTAQPPEEPVELLGATLTTATAGKPGVVVQSVNQDELSRLRTADVIVAFNGEPVTSAQGLVAAVEKVGLGESFKITVVRGSKHFELNELKAATTFLGVDVQDQEEGGKGALVVEVAPGSPAAKAGLRKGDLIVAVDDTTIGKTDDLLEAVGVQSPGDEIQVSAERGSKDVNVTATLVRRPAG